MHTYYGLADEIVPESMATILDTRQTATFGKTNLQLVPLDDASHRGTLLNAAYGQLRWFDVQRGAIPSGIVGSVNPVTGAPAAVENLVATPAGTGQVLLEWSPSAGATSYKLLLNGQTVFDRYFSTSRFFDNLSPMTTYTFTVVPVNASGSGPETVARFGGAKATGTISELPEDMTFGQDGSLWFIYKLIADGFASQIVNDNGTWVPQESISVDKVVQGIVAGQDGAMWVVSLPGSGHLGSDSGSVQRLVKGQDGKWFVEGPAIPTDKNPAGMTVGQDGTLWVASWWNGTVQHIVKDQNGNWGVQRFGDRPSIQVMDNPRDITTGQDGAIWVCGYGDKNRGLVQRITYRDGTWSIEQTIAVDNGCSSIATGSDGSIWVASNPNRDTPISGREYGTVQHIVNENGTWFVKGDPIHVDSMPRVIPRLDGSIWAQTVYGLQHIVTERGESFVKGDPIHGGFRLLTTASDGSLWYNSGNSTFSQLFTSPTPPIDLKVTPGPHEGMATLSWKAPVANGGTPVTSYTVTARQGATIRTFPNWGDTAYRVTGLEDRKSVV
jgi:hypothetical protein